MGYSALVGREHERHLIGRCLEVASGGRSSVLLLEGEPGAGKTALCDFAAASADGWCIVRARAVAEESDLPLAGLSLILRPLLAHRDHLNFSHRRVLDAAVGSSGEGLEDRFALGAATVALVAAAAEERPVLVVVDDVQWLDPTSVDALGFALRRLERDSVAVFLAGQNTSAFPGGVGDTVAVGGLAPVEAQALLSSRHFDCAQVVIGAIVAATGGNPLALLELAAHLSADQRQGLRDLPDPLPVGSRLAQLYQARLAPLPQHCRDALAVVAAAGTATALVGGALESLGLGMETMAPAEELAVVSISSSGARFCHPLLRTAALDILTPARRRAVHRALADAAVEDPQRHAAHLAAASVGPSEAVAGALLIAAADAERRGGPVVSAPILDRAADATSPGELQIRRLMRAGQALMLAGQLPAAVDRLDRVLAASHDPLIRADAALSRSQALVWGPHTGGAAAVVRREGQRLARDAPLRAAVALAQASIGFQIQGDIRAALSLAQEADQIIVGVGGDRLLVLPALASALVLGGGQCKASALLDSDAVSMCLRRAAELPMAAVPSFAYVVQALNWSGRHVEAKLVADVLIDNCRRHSAPYALLFPTAAHFELLWWLGRWAEASACAIQAIGAFADAGLDVAIGFTSAVAARIAAGRGDVARCAELVARASSIAEATGNPVLRLYASHAAGMQALIEGNPADAARALLEADGIAERVGLVNLVAVPYGPDLIEALIRSGAPEEAAAALARYRSRADETASAWGLATAARCAAMLSDGRIADCLFDEALAGTPPGSFDEARSRLCWGEQLRRRRERQLARRQLERALTVFNTLGARPWSERTGVELAALGVRVACTQPPKLAKLTAKELQVGLAVGRGQSNREAATALFISPKTVEFHLSRVYTKLGVSTRTQLARLLQQLESPVTDGPPNGP